MNSGKETGILRFWIQTLVSQRFNGVNATNHRMPNEALVIAKRLHHGLAADQVYLFGSHARGEGTPDSDLDFLVVVPQSSQSQYERAVAARRLVHDVYFPKDIIVLTRAEWETDLTVVCSLASTVLREGIRLDGR
jgi:predicted nucleotidyltransferase